MSDPEFVRVEATPVDSNRELSLDLGSGGLGGAYHIDDWYAEGLGGSGMLVLQTCKTHIAIMHSKKRSESLLDVQSRETFSRKVDVQMLTSAERFIEWQLLNDKMSWGDARFAAYSR